MNTKSFSFCLLLFLFGTLNSYSQTPTPNAFNYQGIARDLSGNPINTQLISIKLNIRTASSNDPIIYTETHSVTTNQFGLFILEIGRGTPVSGTFSGIDWSTANHWLEVEMDPNGGITYVPVGVNELLSVPYAKYAETSGTSGTNGLNCWDANGNGVQDPSEDVNGDGNWNALDCQGATGPQGPQGPTGATGPQGPVGAGMNNMQVFTTSGTFTIPSGVTKIIVEVIGGGGAGGRGNGGSTPGQGGQGGGYSKGIFNVTPGTIYTVTVGNGGTPQTVNCSSGLVSSTWGGTSSFGSLISATGGYGGNGCGFDTGNGGMGSGGQLNIKGQDGLQHYNTSIQNRGGLSGAGINFYGQGGRGTAFFGDPGNPGLVIVYW